MRKQTVDVKRKAKHKGIPVKSMLAIAGILYGLAGMEQSAIYAQAAQDGQAAQGIGSMQETIEVTELSQIMVAERDADMKAAPKEDAETLMTYEKGALVFATGETADGWYRVTYQDKEGYVEKDSLRVQEIDVEGLDAEMAVNEEEAKLVVETVEKYRAEARRSKIWGSVIVTLVAGIFAMGIFSAVRTKKEENGGKVRKQSLEIEDWNG